jgi:hypothetical protein
MNISKVSTTSSTDLINDAKWNKTNLFIYKLNNKLRN